MKKYIVATSLLALLVVALYSCSKPSVSSQQPTDPTVADEAASAGLETVYDQGASAFGDAFPIERYTLGYVHDVGEVVFNEFFTPAPGYAYNYYTGLGTVFNNNSCNACHAGVGEGNPPASFGAPLGSMLFRISIPGTDPHGGPNPIPGFGGQLQNLAVAGVTPEGTVNISYTNINLTFADGSPYQLQAPTYIVAGTYTTFPGSALISPRVAPRLVGLGFLEVLSESSILANVNTSLATGDTSQINGKPNYVWDYTTSSVQLGRFGWKAEAPTLKQQLAAAYQQDMGVTNSVFPEESSYGQPQYQVIPGDPSPELPDSELNANVFYVQTLAVPARRNVNDAQVVQGQNIFNSAGAQCASCHTPSMTTPASLSYPDPQPYTEPELAKVPIHAYTDMLLHDMGVELADNRPAYQATGRQWRTPPLWGIGLVPIIDPAGHYLHDGRARTLMEAIMWHGGEAYASKEYVRNLSASDRAALIAFLQSL